MSILEHKRTILTVLDEPVQYYEIDMKLKDFNEIMAVIHAASDEEMPPIEPMRLKEVEL